MSQAEYLRQRRAARLMYELGFSRLHADAITWTTTYTEKDLVREMGSFRIRGYADEEIVAWCENGFPSTALAGIWKAHGYTPDQAQLVRDWALALPDTRSTGVLLHFTGPDAPPADFVVLCIKAGAKTEAEIATWVQKDDDDPEFRQTLLMLSGLLFEP